MSNVIGLGKVRKARKRAERKAKADENAVTFGRSKVQRKLDANRAEKSETTLDNHKRNDR